MGKELLPVPWYVFLGMYSYKPLKILRYSREQYTLNLIKKEFEVAFSNKLDWYLYQLQGGHLVASP